MNRKQFKQYLAKNSLRILGHVLNRIEVQNDSFYEIYEKCGNKYKLVYGISLENM